MFRSSNSSNVTARIFQRQIRTPAPGTSFHCARRFYENIVPSCTIYDAECPDHSFRKFTEDGRYLISFSRNHQDLIVYRPSWLTFSCKEDDCDGQDLPSKARKFESFFSQLYSVPLASSSELICKDFFLYIESNQFGLFATSTPQVHDAPATGGAVNGVPSVEKITFHLLRLEDGVILDERVFRNDYVNLADLIDEYQKNFGESWRIFQAENAQPWPYLNEALTKFQDPAEVDKLLKIQRELDETKIILPAEFVCHRTTWYNSSTALYW